MTMDDDVRVLNGERRGQLSCNDPRGALKKQMPTATCRVLGTATSVLVPVGGIIPILDDIHPPCHGTVGRSHGQLRIYCIQLVPAP